MAEPLDLYLNDFVDCMEDLETVIKQLPAQQYYPLLSKLEENIFTQSCTVAFMAKGENSSLRTFTQDSVAIDH